MTRQLRTRRPINYYEPDEPPHDAYEFCVECGIFAFEYCSIHGGLLVVPDDNVPARLVCKEMPRAKLSVPNMFLYIDTSSIPGAGTGVFAKRTLPQGVRFGPYCGVLTKKSNSNYCWQIRELSGRASQVTDAADESASNWMRYVNCARHCTHQNLVAYQFHGQIYYRTSQIIRRGSELLVYYGNEFAAKLNIHLGNYNNLEAVERTHPPVKSPGSETLDLVEALKSTPAQTQQAKAHKKALIKLQKCCHKDKLKSSDSDLLDRYNDYRSIFEEIDKLEYKEIEIKQTTDSNLVIEESTDSNAAENYVQDSILDITGNDFRELLFIDDDNEDQEHYFEKKENARKILKEKQDLSESKENAKSRWICNECNKVLGSRNQLRVHIRIHGGAQKFNCTICNYKTHVKYYYKKHEMSHNKSKGAKNENKLKTDNQKDARMSGNKRSWQCEECKNIFNTRAHLRNHKRNHGGAHRFVCSICDYQTDVKYYFERHRATHNKSTLLKCTTCTFSSYNEKVFKIHIDLHANGKTIKCDMCDYLCLSRKYLNAHVRRVHDPTKRHPCGECASAFNCAEYLRRHTRNVHWSNEHSS